MVMLFITTNLSPDSVFLVPFKTSFHASKEHLLIILHLRREGTSLFFYLTFPNFQLGKVLFFSQGFSMFDLSEWSINSEVINI